MLPRILLGVTHQQDVRYGATFLITSGTYSSLGLIIAWCMPQFSHTYSSADSIIQQLVITLVLKQRKLLEFLSMVPSVNVEASWDPTYTP